MSKTADALPDNADQDTFSTVGFRYANADATGFSSQCSRSSRRHTPSPCWVVRTQTRGGSCHASSTTPGPIH